MPKLISMPKLFRFFTAVLLLVVLVICFSQLKWNSHSRALKFQMTVLADVSRENTREASSSKPSNLDQIAIVTVMDQTETAEIIKHQSSAAQLINVQFFKTLLYSFCQTASLGFEYNFYVGFIHTDEAFKKSGQLFAESFMKAVNHSCSHSIKASLFFAALPSFETKSLAVIDTMRLAFMQNNDFFYLVDSKLKMKTAKWVEFLTDTLSKSRPAANLGIVTPSLEKADSESISPFSFVHRKHFDIFGLYYSYGAKQFGEWWLKQVYRTKYFVNQKVEVSCDKCALTVAVPAEAERNTVNAAVNAGQHFIDKWVEGAQVRSSSKRIISFSLYGDAPRYAFGAIRNAQLARLFFPGWTVRFYVVGKGTKYPIPGEGTVMQLKRLGAEFRVLDSEIVNKLPPMFWRFLAGDDSSIEAYIVRDTDSRLSEREADLVADWIQSEAAFHCLRDHPSHGNYALSGGMIGGKPKKLKKYLDHSWRDMVKGYNAGYLQDMNFLNAVIWPKVKDDSLCHDSVSCMKYPKTAPIVSPRDQSGKPYFHIGAVFDEYDQMRKGDVDILKNAGEKKECTNLNSFKQKQG